MMNISKTISRAGTSRAFNPRLRASVGLSRNFSLDNLDRQKGNRERVVILGSGWSGFVLSRQLDPTKFQTVVVSPRSYFVFTPLLASTAVGTLEFRAALEPVRTKNESVEFFQGWADDVHFSRKYIEIEEAATDREGAGSLATPIENREKGRIFDLHYDKLVVSVGCYNQTFNTKGVKENAFFLKDMSDSRKIRKRILECFETAALPCTPETIREKLLNFAIVGGGPTGIEFSAELHDFVHEDLSKIYPNLVPYVKISVYDVASKILTMFDESLSNYALNAFKREGINVNTQYNIEELRPGAPAGCQTDDESAEKCFTLKTKQGGEIGVGMCVWSTGLMMNPFISKALNEVYIYPKDSVVSGSPIPESPIAESDSVARWSLKRDAKTGGLNVDDHFRVKLTQSKDSSQDAVMKDVFALGDVAVMDQPLPATAQVANQQAKWLGNRLNNGDLEKKVFTFKNMGVMTYLGNWKAIMQTNGRNEVKGWTAWVVWRSAYLMKAFSWRNRLLIPIYWCVSWVFGRDISRF